MGRKQRAERARAAAPKREAYLAQHAAAAPRPAGPDPWWKTALLAGSLVAIAGAGVAVWILWIEPWWDRHQLINQTGRPRLAVFGKGVVALIDTVDIDKQDDDPLRRHTIFRSRVTVLDAGTGTQVAQHLFDGDGLGHGCVAATAERMWCDLGPFAVHDAHTFARVATIAETVAAAGVGKPVPDRWHVEGDKAYWLLDDGRAAVVEAATLAVHVEDKAPPELLPHPITGTAPNESGLVVAPSCDPRGDSLLAERGQAHRRQGHLVDPAAQRAALRGDQEGRTGADRDVLATGAADRARRRAADPAPRLDGRGQGSRSVSRLGPDGAAAWTVELQAPCETWRLDGDNLVVTTNDFRGRVVSVDADDGKVRWSR